MDNTTQHNSEEALFTGVEWAYPIAVQSYDVAVKRMDSVDGRLQTTLVFVVSLSAAIITFAHNLKVEAGSIWFFAAAYFFLGCVGTGIWARLHGDIRLLRPRNLYDTWLKDSEWTFKKDMVFHAANDFDANMKLVDLKWRASVVMIILFALQVVCLSVWVALGPRGNCLPPAI